MNSNTQSPSTSVPSRLSTEQRRNHALLNGLDQSLISINQGRKGLPDIEGYGYDKIESEGPADVHKLWQYSQKFHDRDIDHEDIPANCGLIRANAEEYLTDFFLAEILEYPTTYSRMDSFDTVFRWSIDGKTRVISRDIRQSIRLVNGKGRFGQDEITIALSALGDLIVDGPRGTFWVEIPPSRRVSSRTEEIPEPPTSIRKSIEGVHIPEENPRIRSGLRHLFSLLHEPDVDHPRPNVYLKFQPHPGKAIPPSHQIRLTDGSTLEIGHLDANLLQTHTNPLQSITGATETTVEGVTYSTEIPPKLAGEVGKPLVLSDGSPTAEWLNDWTGTHEGTIIGYYPNWETQKIQSYKSTKIESVTFHLETLLLTPNNEFIVHRETIDEFKHDSN